MTVIGLVAFSAALVGNGQGTARADPNPPGNDGECTHGNSDQPCRPDPQPDHGKDCEAHGANFDGNEDHCLAEPTEVPTEEPTEVPTEEPTEVPTESPPSIVITVEPTTAAVESTAVPPAAPVETAASPTSAAVESAAQPPAAPVTALPSTGSGGVDSGKHASDLTWASLALLGTGGGLLLLSWRMRRDSE